LYDEQFDWKLEFFQSNYAKKIFFEKMGILPSVDRKTHFRASLERFKTVD